VPGWVSGRELPECSAPQSARHSGERWRHRAGRRWGGGARKEKDAHGRRLEWGPGCSGGTESEVNWLNSFDFELIDPLTATKASST